VVGNVIVLDTHALVWWTQQPELLGAGAASAIDRADRILVPSICFWETSLLVRKGRLALKRGQPVAVWAQEVLSIPRLRAVALSVELALEADALDMHPDPADRFIVATALRWKCPLVTKDELLQGVDWLQTVW
jgi:PIN domain nuclease of toxin-antitoxin system